MKKQIIGRSDIADFPALSIQNIEVKIDTGAYTSSIHCEDITEENQQLKCRFLTPNHPEYQENFFTFKNYKVKKVKSSNGISEKRYIIDASIRLFGRVYNIALSLSDRKDMKFPVLLGRKFLKGKFIVDPTLINQSYDAENEY